MREITPVIYAVDNGYAGFAAELPGATGQGKTIEETIEEIREAIEELVVEYRMRNVPVPWRMVVRTEPVQIAV